MVDQTPARVPAAAAHGSVLLNHSHLVAFSSASVASFPGLKLILAYLMYLLPRTDEVVTVRLGIKALFGGWHTQDLVVVY